MALDRSFVPPSLERDSKVTRLDAKSYATHLHTAFCVGAVPNGGYVASVFLNVASAHLSPRNQPDTISANWQFLSRTQAGPAVLVVEESKMGRGMSVLHISLYQDGLLPESPWVPPGARRAVVAYITNGLIESETGVTLPTGWALSHVPPPADLTKLPAGEDAHWERMHIPLMAKLPMLHNLEFYMPRAGHPLPATHDLWVRLANGERFTPSSLGYVADAGPPLIVESYRPASRDAPVPEGGFPFGKGLWYPTVSMSLDVKRRLPALGEEWLRLSVVTKAIQNGRYDAELLVFDGQGALVALSHHVALAVDVARNSAQRRPSKV